MTEVVLAPDATTCVHTDNVVAFAARTLKRKRTKEKADKAPKAKVSPVEEEHVQEEGLDAQEDTKLQHTIASIIAYVKETAEQDAAALEEERKIVAAKAAKELVVATLLGKKGTTSDAGTTVANVVSVLQQSNVAASEVKRGGAVRTSSRSPRFLSTKSKKGELLELAQG